MKLGFMTAILPDLSLDAVLSLASAEKFACVELMCWPTGAADRRYAGVTHVDVRGLDKPAAERIRGMAQDAGVDISGLGYYPNPLEPDSADARACIEHIEHVLQAARLLDVGVVNTFVGRDWTRSVEGNWPRFLEVWKPLVQRAEDLGVRIAIENCPMLFTGDEWPGGKNLAYSPAIWRLMFEAIPSPNFGLNFDPSHLVWQQIDCAKALHAFKDRIFHVHAKDAQVDHDRLAEVGVLAAPLAWHTPKLPGLGDVDWGEFFRALEAIGYDGPVCIEVEDRDYEPDLDQRKEALRKSRDFLRRFIPA